MMKEVEFMQSVSRHTYMTYVSLLEMSEFEFVCESLLESSVVRMSKSFICLSLKIFLNKSK